MGAWGTGVFSDDVACEVRDEYRAMIGDGHDGTVATDALLVAFREVLEDIDAAPVLWLALAVMQWRLGRLEARVKDRALQVLDDGSALRPWQGEPSLLAARRKELAKVANLVKSPQPNRKSVCKRFKNTCEWEAGELIGFRVRSGRQVIFRVIGDWTDRGGTSPVVEVLDWCGDEIPERAVLERLPIRSSLNEVPPGLEGWISPRRSQFVIGEVSMRRIPRDRITRLQIKLRPSQDVGGVCCWLWRTIDNHLETEFGYT